MSLNIDRINQAIKNKSAFIQKIMSTSRYLCFRTRIPGQNIWIYLGRGSGYEGIWYSEEAPHSMLRTSDRLLQFSRKYLINSSLEAIEIGPWDRVIQFKMHKNKADKLFCYFYGGRKSYFLYEDQETSFLSWKGKLKQKCEKLEEFNEVGRRKLEQRKQILKESDIHNLLADEKKKIKSLIVPKKSEKKQALKIKRIEQDLLKVQKWKSLQTYLVNLEDPKNIDLNIFNLSKSLAKKKFDNPYQLIDVLHGRIKKWKKAEIILKQRLEVAQRGKLSKGNNQVLKVIGPVWGLDKKRNEVKREKSSHYQVMRFGKLVFAIGLDAQGNDELRNSWSKSTDWWFHLEGTSSAHAYLRGVSSLTPDLIQWVGSAILSHKTGHGKEMCLVMYALRKSIKGFKGKQGAVTVKNAKQLSIRFEPNWEKKLHTYVNS